MLPRTHSPGALRPFIRIAFIGAVVAAATAAVTVAGPTESTRVLSSQAVERAGLSIPWTAAMVGGSPLAVSQARLLAVAPHVTAVAIASGTAGSVSDLVIARTDGSQVRLAAASPSGAIFAPDVESLAMVDGSGQLQRVNTSDGSVSLVAAGPFASRLAVLSNGDLLALRVDSIDAPMSSELVLVHPDGSVETLLADLRLIYRAFALASGDVWALAHRPGRAPALVAAAGGSLVYPSELGLDLDVSPDGTLLAWSVAGGITVAAVDANQPTRLLADGSMPRFSEGSDSLLIRRGLTDVVVGTDGSKISDLTGLACWGGDGECQP